MGFLSNLDAQKKHLKKPPSPNRGDSHKARPSLQPAPAHCHDETCTKCQSHRDVRIYHRQKKTKKIHYHTFAVSINDEGL